MSQPEHPTRLAVHPLRGSERRESIVTLSERIVIDSRRRNIAVTDRVSRENLADYDRFCS